MPFTWFELHTMYESKRYEAWLHTAVLRHDILTVCQFGRKKRKYKIAELHLPEIERCRRNITWMSFDDAVNFFVKNREDNARES